MRLRVKRRPGRGGCEVAVTPFSVQRDALKLRHGKRELLQASRAIPRQAVANFTAAG